MQVIARDVWSLTQKDDGGHAMCKIAVLLPCYNEQLTIAKVVADFKRELPTAEIWVYDNDSTDGSAKLAAEAGANVRIVKQRGKGHVVRCMFREIEADYYVMADSDDTYPADGVHELLESVISGGADMAVGDRLSSTYRSENRRPFHNFGNTLVVSLIRNLFHTNINDVMSGYRVFNRIFVKSCPILSQGFEIETEITLHALAKRMAIAEKPIAYRDRPVGSKSKLATFKDGFKVLKTVFDLFRYYRPLFFFSVVSSILMFFAILLFVPVLLEYCQTGMVPKFPSLIVSTMFALASLFSFVCGLILDAVCRHHRLLFEIVLNRCSEGGRNGQIQ